jgi:PEP-CTERM motif
MLTMHGPFSVSFARPKKTQTSISAICSLSRPPTVALGLPTSAVATGIVFSEGGGANPADIQDTVNLFRTALGDPNNGNAPGPLPGGRREINWDGGGNVDVTTPLPPITPFNVFLNTRGSQFTTPGSGLTQAPPSGGPTGGLQGLFSNPTYGTTFSTFSPLRLFVPAGSNITDGLFFLPGTNGGTRATVSGFGAVFTDVDLPNTTQIQYFDIHDNLVAASFVPPGTVPDGSLSFLGVLFDDGERIARVRITTGNTALGPNDGNWVDVVAMDDFLYSELNPVPEPSTLLLLGTGAVWLGGTLRRRASLRTTRARTGVNAG